MSLVQRSLLGLNGASDVEWCRPGFAGSMGGALFGLAVKSKIADGSAAEAYLVRDQVFERNVIVEVLHQVVVDEPAVSARVFQLVREGQTRVHPRLLARQHAWATESGRVLLCTSPMPGVPAAHVLAERGPFSRGEVIDVMLPVLGALSCMHSCGQRHGNLTLQHILVEPERLKQAWLYDTQLTLTRLVPSALGAALVKHEYLAPERVRGRRGMASADIYAVGVAMFELLTGAPPFTGATAGAIRKQHLESEVPPVPGESALSEIIARCMAKEPAARFADVATLERELRAVGSPRNRGPDTAIMDVSTLGQLKMEVGVGEEGDLAQRTTQVGERLGPYELQELLGQGGMGRVFLARHVPTGKEVALKVLRVEMSKDEMTLKRFLDEATLVSRLHHPHIVEVYDLVNEPDCTYCVMEPLRGVTLGELLQDKVLSIARALGLMIQVCEALVAAHQLGVIHRDVKPDNIFVVQDEHGQDAVKLLDFGVAKQQPTAESGVDRQWQTQGGVMVGTPLFMAPEQALGESVDARTDVYIVGTVLYLLMAGVAPFAAPSVQGLISKLLTEPPPALPACNPRGEKISPTLAAAVMRCLEKEPGNRWPSMAELASALKGELRAS